MNFHIWKSKGRKGLWYWHLKAGNGEIIATGQGYKYQRDAIRCVDLIRSTQMISSVVHTYAASFSYPS